MVSVQHPPLFTPPYRPAERFTLGAVALAPLGLDDLAEDFEAVMESAAALKGLFAAEDPWPEGLTERADLIDLAWHQREFAAGSSFAWGLRRAENGRYLGSSYVYADPTKAADMHAVHWIRASESDPALRQAFAADWRAWANALPAASIRFSQA